MSDEDQGSVTNDEVIEDLDDLSVDDLKAKVAALEADRAKIRREAAGRRVANKEKDAELEEFRAWKESQKTEAQKLAERAEAAEKKAANLELKMLRKEIAEEVGLDPKLADRIRGDSEDEMLADARELAEGFSGRANRDLDPYAGRRGTAVKGELTASEEFNHWLDRQSGRR